jgi:hypothetical protein
MRRARAGGDELGELDRVEGAVLPGGQHVAEALGVIGLVGLDLGVRGRGRQRG